MKFKKEIIDGIIKREGGYVNNPHDSGGPTKFGITEKTAVAYGYGGEMQSLPRELAYEIYSARHWDAIRCDEMAGISEAVAGEICDTGVHCGPMAAVKMLQLSLIVLADVELAQDGIIGSKTLDALKSHIADRGETNIMRALNSLQGHHYLMLGLRRPKDRVFTNGWFAHRVVI